MVTKKNKRKLSYVSLRLFVLLAFEKKLGSEIVEH